MFEFIPQNRSTHGVAAAIAVLVFVTMGNSQHVQAQSEATHWKFGQGAGLDFSSGVPVPTSSALLHLEGSASFSDSNGNLLFYSDGFQAWQRDDVRMPGFQYEMPDSMSTFHSTTQQALIVPYDINPSRFIVFNPGNSSSVMPENTINNFEWFAEARYHASWLHVDMSSNAGFGRISSRAIDTNGGIVLSEKLTGTLDCDGEGYWVVMRERNGPRFISYKVENGIVEYPPVISENGTFSGSDTTNLGTMKISPDGKWLAMARGWSEPGEVQLFEFNSTDGKVRRGFTLKPVTANDVYEYYGVAFSDDSKMLYVTSGPNLLQYDLTRPTQQEIAESGFHVKTEFSIPFGNLGALQLGPDKKLYVPLVQSEFVGVIHNPRKRFDACGFEVLGVELLPGTRAYYGLPNFMDHIFAPDSIIAQCLSPAAAFLFDDVCELECIEYEDVSANAPETWEWFFEGGTPSSWMGQFPPPICYGTPGSYTTTLKITARGEEDYFNQVITVHAKPKDLFERDTLRVCESPTTLVARGAASYEFSTGLPISDSSVSVFGDEGWVYVTGVSEDGCRNVDSIFVDKHALNVSVSPDVELCQGDSTTLSVSGGLEYLWTTSTHISALAVPNPIVWPTSTTTFSCVVMGDHGCTTTVSVKVNVLPMPIAEVTLSDTVLCEGKELTVVLQNPEAFDRTQWLRNGQVVSTQSEYQSVVHKGDVFEVVVELGTCVVTLPLDVTVRDSVQLHVPEDVSLCLGETTTIEVTTNAVSIEWFGPNAPLPGTSTFTVTPTETTTYVIVADNGACTKIDSLVLRVDGELNVSSSPDTTICLGSAVALTVTEGDSYSWSPSTGLSASNIREPIANPSTTTTYTVTVERGSCEGTTTVTISVDEPPNVTVSTLATLCPDESFVLQAFGAEEYVWLRGSDTIGFGAELTDSFPTSEELTLIAKSGACEELLAIAIPVVPIDEIAFEMPNIIVAIGKPTVATIEVDGIDAWVPIYDKGTVTIEVEFDAKTVEIQDTLSVVALSVSNDIGYVTLLHNISDLGVRPIEFVVERLMSTISSSQLAIRSVVFEYEECNTVFFDPHWTSGSIERLDECIVYDIESVGTLQTTVALNTRFCQIVVDGGAGDLVIQLVNSTGIVVGEQRVVTSERAVHATIHNNLAAGMYVVRISRGRQQALHRILLVP